MPGVRPSLRLQEGRSDQRRRWRRRGIRTLRAIRSWSRERAIRYEAHLPTLRDHEFDEFVDGVVDHVRMFPIGGGSSIVPSGLSRAGIA